MNDYIDFAHHLKDVLRPCTIIELGSGWGVTTAILLAAARQSATVITVDIIGDADPRSIAKIMHPNQKLIPVHGDATKPETARLVQSVLPGPADLLYIDTSHEFNDDKLEVELFASMVAPSGMIAFHDSIGKRDRVWDRLRDRHPTDSVLWGRALGIGSLFPRGSIDITGI
jgi:predicted O-methyltransferase YrrM